jgi:hypothetical protein
VGLSYLCIYLFSSINTLLPCEPLFMLISYVTAWLFIVSTLLNKNCKAHNITLFSVLTEYCSKGAHKFRQQKGLNKKDYLYPKSRQSAKLFFSLRNWDPPPPHPQASVSPLPLFREGGVHPRLRERGEVPVPTRG